MLADTRPLLAGCRVLIVEDEYFLASVLEAELKSCGAEIVGPIPDIHEAARQISVDGFDLALLDINLRDELAYPVADELLRRGVPFCFITGYSAEMLPARFRQLRRLEKPFEVRDVLEYVAGLCDRSVPA